jgi:hypothetical protein
VFGALTYFQVSLDWSRGQRLVIFVQLTGFNGFAVEDFATCKEIKRIQNPDLPPGKATVPEGSDPSHGMAVTSDGKTLVVYSRLNNFLYTYSLPDVKLIGATRSRRNWSYTASARRMLQHWPTRARRRPQRPLDDTARPGANGEAFRRRVAP